MFLNHHGYQTYPPYNNGLPFGPHPHRGMETITFIIEGDIMHKDSQGYQSTIRAGGVQWMTAGKGLIYAEVSSDDFKENGGPLEILQLWLNLPARLKMTAPAYLGLQKEDIPQVNIAQGVEMQLIAGNWGETQGAFEALTDVFMSTLQLSKGSSCTLQAESARNIFFYVVRGTVSVNGSKVAFRNLVEFNNDHDTLQIQANDDSLLIFGHATPYKEPVVAYGPFVMDTEAEIQQAYHDYQQGKFGVWTA